MRELFLSMVGWDRAHETGNNDFDLNTASPVLRPPSSSPLEMDGVCIKIGLIFPVALQEAIKNLKLRFCCWLAGWLALSSRVALTRERKRERVGTGEKENSI